MNTPTNIQIITQEGRPAFVVIPFEEYMLTRRGDPRIPENGFIPNEVVKLNVIEGLNLVRAWREYLGLTQAEVAERMGITQAALSQMESGRKRLRKTTIDRLAIALGVNPEQLTS